MPDTPVPCRLAFLIRDLGHGGAQRQLVTLAKALAARGGFEVTVVHFYPGFFEQELNAAGVQTRCVGKRHRWDLLGFFARLLGVFRELRPHVIHGYLHESNLMALLLKPWCGFPKIFWGIRDSQTDADTWGVLGKLSFRLNCLLSGYADGIIANSRAGRHCYLGHGYPRRGFEVVPNGIDIQRFALRGKVPAGNTFTLIGRLHPMKDHATFLKALAEVPAAEGRIIGNGDAAYAREMKSLAARLGVDSRVSWEPARDDLPSLYPTLNCLVSSSAYGEGFSNVIGEAMACGVPCIASDVGDSAWLLQNDRWVFPAGDSQALAERMRRFLDLDVQSREVLGQQNRQRIEDHFTITNMVDQTAQLLCPPVSAAPSKGVAAGPDQDPPSLPPRHVLWITTGLGTGGAEMMLVQLIAGLKDCEHTVISLTGGGKHVAPLQAAGTTVHSLDMPAGKPTLGAIVKLFRFSRAARPDVIMGWMYHGCLAAQIAKVAAGGEIVWNIRQSLYDLKLEKRGSALVIRALARLSRLPAVITYNSSVSARQHEALGYRQDKTRLIPNGFDTEKWQPSTRQPSQPLRVGRFGRYTAMKDFPTFLEAAAIMARQVPDVRLVLAGTGVDANNAELTETIRRLHLESNVDLLGERHDLPALTASLDLAVSSSAFGEGFPNVVGEAMACAVPVVATEIGDTAWVMGETGRRVPARNPESLAAAAIEILTSPPEKMEEIGQRGRLHIIKHFSLSSVLRQFRSVIQCPSAEP